MISFWIEAKVLLRLLSPTGPIPLLPPPFQKTPSPHQVPNFISSPITLSSFLFQPHWPPFVPQTCHVHSSSWLLNLSVSLWGIFSLSYPHCFLPCFFQVQVYGAFPECFIEKASLYHHHQSFRPIFLMLFYLPPEHKWPWDSLHIYILWLSLPHFCPH